MIAAPVTQCFNDAEMRGIVGAVQGRGKCDPGMRGRARGGSDEANRAMRSGAIMPRVKRSAQVTAQRKERRAGRLELSPLFYFRGIITTATADAIFI